MPKKGKQLHDFYFDKYECFHFSNSKEKGKSEISKKYTKKFKNYEFNSYIAEFVEESKIMENETYKEFEIDKNDVVDIIERLFYTHVRLAKNILCCEIYDADVYVNDLSQAINEFEKHNKFFEISITPNKYKGIIRKRFKLDSIIGTDAAYFLLTEHSINFDYITLITFLMRMHKNLKNSTGRCQIASLLQFPDEAEDWKEEPVKNLPTYTYTVDAYKEIKDCYKSVLKEDAYVKFKYENKFLEKQMLDLFFGCEVVGYIFRDYIESNYKKYYEFLYDVIQKTGCLSLLGMSPCIERIIKKRMVKEKTRKENNELENTEKMEDYIEAQFTEDVLKIFFEVMRYFLEYLYLLGSYEKRKNYVENIPEEQNYSLTNNWEYFFNENLIKETVYDENADIKNNMLDNQKLNVFYKCYFDSFDYVDYETYFFFRKETDLNPFFV